VTAAPVGAVVGIFYDAHVEVLAGDAIVSTTGRTYVVVAVRRQARGEHVGRWHLRCLVARGPPPGARVHRLRWYPRGRRRAPRPHRP
jgi:hypothetical protein